MNPGIEILIISFVVIIIAAVIGFSARSRNVSLEQWAVGGRKIGGLLIWFLLAGEIYTAFTFLGVPGYAYAYGAPAYYALSYGVLAYLTSYFILPKIWRIAKKKGMMTQPDFFRERYQSKGLATIVAIIGVVFMVPYLELQVGAITDILNVMGYGVISPAYVMIITFSLTAGFVIVNGLRSATFTAFFKDALALIIIFVALIVIPIVQFGGITNMMNRINVNFGSYLYFPGHSPLGLTWFVSVVLMSALGFFMWPHAFQSYISAKNDVVLKRNAVFLPIYNVLLVITIFMGFAALLYSTKISNPDYAFLIVARASFPTWWNGIVAGGITLGAMVPAAVLLIASSTIISKNLYRDLINKKASDASVKTIAQVFVAIVTLVALLFAIELPTLFVNLLLIGYSGITLFFPGIVLGITWRRVTKLGVATGIIGGLITNIVFFLPLSRYSTIIYPGMIGLVVASILTIAVSLITSAPPKEVIDEFLGA